MTTATQPAPTLFDALMAFRQALRRGDASPADGPRVRMARPVRHFCYRDEPCGFRGRVTGFFGDSTALVNVRWDCGRDDWMNRRALVLADEAVRS